PRRTTNFAALRRLRAGATWIASRRALAGAVLATRRGGSLPASSPSPSGARAWGQLQQPLAQQPHLGHAALAGDLEELQAPLAEVEQVARVTACARLDARQDLVDAPVVPVGGDEQAAECVMGAPVVVPVQVRRETAPHLGEVVEAVRVEELLVEVGVEDLDLTVPLLVLGLEVIDPELGEQ